MTNKGKIQKIREIGQACVARLLELHKKQKQIMKNAIQKREGEKLQSVRSKLNDE